MREGQRVKLPNHKFLSDGKVKRIHFSGLSGKPFGVTVKLDKPAPKECSMNAFEVFMFIGDVEVIE